MAETQEHVDSPESNGQPATVDRAGTDDKPEEFQRFEDLARRLIDVPKVELDEKRKNKS